MFGIKTKIKNKILGRIFKTYFIFAEYCKNMQNFDVRFLDEDIKNFAINACKSLKFEYLPKNNRIALLTTHITDMGGHAELIKNVATAFSQEYELKLFLSRIKLSQKTGAKKLKEFSEKFNIDGIEFNYVKEKEFLRQLLHKVIEFRPKIIVSLCPGSGWDCFIHAVLVCLKKYTNTRIIYCNVASQYPALGMSFADIIWEGMPATAFVTQKYRHFRNTCTLGLCYLKEEDLPQFTEIEISDMRKKIGLPKNALCTMSGASSYKFFTKNTSPYLAMVRRLLERNENLYHILVTQLNNKQKNILNTVFANSKTRSRLILLNFSVDFKKIFKCADVFVDSFPFSSALTLVDLMTLKIPAVVKINTNNLICNFYEYMPKNYPYAFEKTEDMEHGIEKLLSDKQEQKRIVEMNYMYYLKTFEGKRFAKNFIEIAESENLTSFYDKEINEEQYKKFRTIKLITHEGAGSV
jgi:hypothetical protein